MTALKNDDITKLTPAAELTRELIRIESTDPGCYEGNIEKFVKGWLEDQISALPGRLAKGVVLKELEALPGRREIMSIIPGTDETLSRMVLICHMDTVVIGEDWKENIDPLGAQIKDGKIFGRGSCDMKSGLACAMTAFAHTLERVKQQGEYPKRSLALIATVDEEADMRGVEAAIKAGWAGSDEWILDCEPTDGMLQIAHKGRTWFELTIKGITAHASKPEEGADAIAAMAAAVSYIHEKIKAQPVHEELGCSTVTFGQIEGGYQPYVVPDSCKVWIDMRLVPPCDTGTAEKIVREAIDEARRQVPGTKGAYVITGDRPSIERDPDSPFAKAVLKAADAAGYPAKTGIFTGYTDTAVIAGQCKNRNCMSYGPGSLALAHKPNEYVDIADITRVEAVLKKLMGICLWENGGQNG